MLVYFILIESLVMIVKVWFVPFYRIYLLHHIKANKSKLITNVYYTTDDVVNKILKPL